MAALTDSDLDRVAAVLGVDAEREGDVARLSLSDDASGRRLAVEVARDLDAPGGPVTVVSAYSAGAFSQLHGCTGVVASEDLGEAIFFAREGDRVSGLVVEALAGCSLYANVAEKLLSADFTALPPETTMAALALSLSEPLFD